MSEENYRWLSSYAGELQRHLGRHVSIDETVDVIRRGNSILDLAGSWAIPEKEAHRIKKFIKAGWKRWQIGSV